MKNSIKIVYGLLMTIAFCLLITLITISDLIVGASVGIDIGAFTIYSTAMHHIAIAKVREPKPTKKKEG